MRDVAVWATMWIVCTHLAIDWLQIEGSWLMLAGVISFTLSTYVTSKVQVWAEK